MLHLEINFQNKITHTHTMTEFHLMRNGNSIYSIKFERIKEKSNRIRIKLFFFWRGDEALRWCCKQTNRKWITKIEVMCVWFVGGQLNERLNVVYIYNTHRTGTTYDTQPIYTRTIWYVQLSFVDIIKWEKTHSARSHSMCVSFFFFAENK